MESEMSWYAVYTKPRWEKKVAGLLKNVEVEAYCPVNKVRKRWSDRVKTVLEPLIPGYVFVRIDAAGMEKVRRINGILNFVYWNGQPAIIKDWEIENLKRFLNDHESASVVAFDVRVQANVKVKAGILMNAKAEVVGIRSKKAELYIESLGCKVVTEISNLELDSLL